MHDVLIRCIGTHIYRLHGGATTSSNIQERRGPSVNIQDTYVPYIYTQQTERKICEPSTFDSTKLGTNQKTQNGEVRGN
jgi:hypothetical protein